MNHLFQALIFLTILGCSPRVLVNEEKSASYVRDYDPDEPFGFVFEEDLSVDTSNYLGKIEVLDGGLTLNCDLPTIQSIAKEKAQELGGNLIYVYEHMTPDLKSTCHRIRGHIFRVHNPRDYETEISWSENRKLEIKDFKGSTENRPLQAATYSGFSYFIVPKPFTKKYVIKSQTTFDCTLSYFKQSDSDEYTLRHEQIHFDISELYRRKLMKEFLELQMKPKEMFATHQSVFDKYWKELNLKQDEYDSEVYSDRSKQPKWNDWIVSELKAFRDFSANEIEIKGE